MVSLRIRVELGSFACRYGLYSITDKVSLSVPSVEWMNADTSVCSQARSWGL